MSNTVEKIPVPTTFLLRIQISFIESNELFLQHIPRESINEVKVLTNISVATTTVSNQQLSTGMDANEKQMDEISDVRQRHHRTFIYDLKNIHKKSAILSDVTDVTIDSFVHIVEESAFFHSSLLVHVEFCNRHGHLRTISASAFQYCTGLEQISLPSSLISIDPLAFSGCTSLAKVEWVVWTTLTSNQVCPNDDSVMLETIGGYAFAGCQSLLSFTLPSRVTKLSQGTSQGCIWLKKLDLSKGLKSIGAYALEHCVSLQSISVPSTVTSIGNSAFSGCLLLKQVELQQKGMLRSVGKKSFADCRSLSAISIPLSVNEIGREAFLDCTGLLGLHIPADSRVQLEKSCFAGCFALVSVCIPPSVTYVPYDCFSNCHAMLKHTTKQPGEPSSSSTSLHPVLRSRYEDLPIHQVCYYAASCSVEDLKVAVRLSDPNKWTDIFGMTPLHILATSPTIRTEFWNVLLTHYSLRFICHKDANRMSLMDYLMLPHRSYEVNPLIQMALHRIIIAEMETYHPWGSRSWINDMARLIDSMGSKDGEDQTKDYFVCRRNDLQMVAETLAGYLRMEVTSILELALWKLKIACLSPLEEGELKLNRCSLRSVAGMSILVPNVIGYLWDEATPGIDLAYCLLQINFAPL